jgi:hypothetical protein
VKVWQSCFGSIVPKLGRRANFYKTQERLFSGSLRDFSTRPKRPLQSCKNFTIFIRSSILTIRLFLLFLKQTCYRGSAWWRNPWC